MQREIDWLAPKSGHDWKDKDVAAAIAWIKSFSLKEVISKRIDAVRVEIERNRRRIVEGEDIDEYSGHDSLAYYLLQAESFSEDRNYSKPSIICRIVPIFKRLGEELNIVKMIGGVEGRVERIVSGANSQPDGGLFELLVALAYRRRGWERVEFVPETPGRGRTHDLNVYSPSKRWAVECKRVMPSKYAEMERQHGQKLAQKIHEKSILEYKSIVSHINFKKEIEFVPDDYLEEHIERASKKGFEYFWADEIANGYVSILDLCTIRRVLRHDIVYFGGSRMIELITGKFRHDCYYSKSIKWRCDQNRIAYADAVYHASIVSWRNTSVDSIKKKGRHFKSILSDAESQLPSDRLGVVHIGVENSFGVAVDMYRHFANARNFKSFSSRNSKLRWVYINYFVPEETTHPDEAWAITETMVPYKIGRHRAEWPLPDHFLLLPESEGRKGVHWDAL